MKMVGGGDHHRIHLVASNEVAVVLKATVCRQSQLAAGGFQRLGINVADRDNGQMAGIQQVRDMYLLGNAAQSDQTNSDIHNTTPYLTLNF